MTRVTIVKPEDGIPILQCKPRVWYKVSEYYHNTALVGDIGVAINVPILGTILVTPDGSSYHHPDMRVQELQEVEIKVKG